MKKVRLKLLSYCCICFLLISPTCVVVSDKKNRKEEINNAAQSLGEHVLWKKVKKTKEVIDETYHKIHALQDSIDQARYLVQSVTGLGVASIENELLDIHDLTSDVDAYVAGVPGNSYGLMLRQLYQQPDAARAAQQLTDMLYYTDKLPKETKGIEKLLAEHHNFRLYFQEFADKRAVQTAQTYRKWAKLYRKKGMELSRKVLQDKVFSMSDYERIRTQQTARQYIVMSYEFIEKSDSLMLSVTSDQDAISKVRQAQAEQYLFTKNLFK